MCIVLLVVALAGLQVLHMAMLSRLDDSKSDPAKVRAARRREDVSSMYRTMVDAIEAGEVIDSSGQYRIVNFLVRSRWSAQRQNHIASAAGDGGTGVVTLASQCSVNHLYRVIDQYRAWPAPASVAVFATTKHLAIAVEILVRLRVCVPSMFWNVSVHLIFPLSQTSAAGHAPPLSSSGTIDDDSCAGLYKSLERQSSVTGNYAWGGVLYPNNLLRNVALDNSETEYAFVVDIDMIPSANLSSDFSAFIAGARHLYPGDRLMVYVVPAFEIRDRTSTPADKLGLLQLWNRKHVRPFYQELCWKCHRHTNYTVWRNLSLAEPMAVGFEATWHDPWEPFYITPLTIPRYDERFKQYGFNRISQVSLTINPLSYFLTMLI